MWGFLFFFFLSSRVWRRRLRGASDNKRWGSFVREHSAIDFLFSLFFFFLSLLFPCLSLWIRRSSIARYENEEREKRIYQELEGFAADIFRYEFLALTNLSVMGDFCIFSSGNETINRFSMKKADSHFLIISLYQLSSLFFNPRVTFSSCSVVAMTSIL